MHCGRFNLCLVYKDDFVLCNLGNYLWHFNVVRIEVSQGSSTDLGESCEESFE